LPYAFHVREIHSRPGTRLHSFANEIQDTYRIRTTSGVSPLGNLDLNVAVTAIQLISVSDTHGVSVVGAERASIGHRSLSFDFRGAFTAPDAWLNSAPSIHHLAQCRTLSVE
jgi:hypothetical protein